MAKSDDESRDDVLKRMLKTPPKPHKPIDKIKKGCADVAIKGGREKVTNPTEDDGR
jgi:hypothetical protein